MKYDIKLCSFDTISSALNKLNKQSEWFTLFVMDNGKVIGTITDGDIRRGLLNGFKLESPVEKIMNDNFIFFEENIYDEDKLKKIREKKINIIPLVSKNGNLLRVFNFNETKSILPIHAVIMAGGKGTRLKPLTNNTPKPLLHIADKEIISYNFDRLLKYGIINQSVSVNYLGNMVEDFCMNYNSDINFEIVKENKYLGTAGSLSLVNNFKNNLVLFMNSDLLTDIDFEDFYKFFIKSEADFLVASVPHVVSIPYAILETQNEDVKSFHEKPEHTYYANAGIYMMKRELINIIPKNKFFDATDLMNKIISLNMKLVHYPINGYWIDIGKPEDFKKANKDIINLSL